MHAAQRSLSEDEEARVSIASVRGPIVGRVDRRTQAAMTLTRDLSLLRIGTVVRDESGRSGRIDGVWIAMDGDVPALCVEIAYDRDARSGRPPAVRADATIGYERDSVRPSAPSSAPSSDPSSDRPSAVTADGRSSGTRARTPSADDTNRHATLDGAAEPPPTVPIRASAIVVRLSLLDRLLDAIDALRDRWSQAVREILRRSPLSS